MTIAEEEAKAAAIDQVALHQRDYRLTFGTPWGQKVLMDLVTFCRAAETCVAAPSKMAPVDLNRTLILEGRREVFLRIQRNLSLTPDQLFKLFGGQSVNLGEAND